MKKPTEAEIKIFVEVLESLSFDKLCLVAGQALIRAAERVPPVLTPERKTDK